MSISIENMIEILKIITPILLFFCGVIWGILKITVAKLLKDIKYSIHRVDSKVDKFGTQIDVLKEQFHTLDKEVSLIKLKIYE